MGTVVIHTLPTLLRSSHTPATAPPHSSPATLTAPLPWAHFPTLPSQVATHLTLPLALHAPLTPALPLSIPSLSLHLTLRPLSHSHVHLDSHAGSCALLLLALTHPSSLPPPPRPPPSLLTLTPFPPTLLPSPLALRRQVPVPPGSLRPGRVGRAARRREGRRRKGRFVRERRAANSEVGEGVEAL